MKLRADLLVLVGTTLLFTSLGWALVYGANRTFGLGLTETRCGLAALLVGGLLAAGDELLPRRLFRLCLGILFTVTFFDTFVTLFHTLMFFAILGVAFASVVFGNPLGLYLLGRRAGRRKRL